MDAVAQSSAEDREAMFQETAARMGIGSAVIAEKDFWVCWTLKHLFENPDIPALLFKGGTSLSKAFGLIERFSEDIDLSLRREDLGFADKNDPLQITGKNARKRKIDELSIACKDAVRTSVLPVLRTAFEAILGDAQWALDLSENDPAQSDIRFEYPSSLAAEEYGLLDYIRPAVRLEIGARADHQPAVSVSVRSYASEFFPDIFTNPEAEVFALQPERTFWEKATIFHAENNRPPREGTPPAWTRLSRHAYDLVMMERHGVAERAIADVELLAAVVRHKEAFFHSGWAEYEKAAPGTFRLTPVPQIEASLRQDYEKMSPMFFGDIPTFDELINSMRKIDGRINNGK